MKKMKTTISHFFLWGGILLATLSLLSVINEGANGGGGYFAITGAVFAAAGLLALKD
jgi:hypothetical protein